MLAESNLSTARQKISDLEKQLEGLRSELAQAKDELSRERASHADKLSEMQKEIIQLANDLSTSRHDFGAKSAELNAKTSEADNLQVMLVEAQRTIERLTEDNKRLEMELLAKGKLEGEMTDLREELEGLRKQLKSNNAMIDELNGVIESLESELKTMKEELSVKEDESSAKDVELVGLRETLQDAKDALASAQRDTSAKDAELGGLREALQDAKDARAAVNVELARVNGLFEESQRLLAARDLSLAEALKNVEFLTAEEKRLQVELGKSEHMRVHHEGNHTAAETGKIELEGELQKLRESLVETNMSLNHSNVALEELKGKYDDAMNRSTEVESERKGLQEELTASQHDNELLRRDLSKAQGELDHVTRLYKDSEETMASSRQKMADLESELEQLRESVVLAKEAMANESADLTSKMSDVEKELLMAKHDLELKVGDLKTALRDLENAQSEVFDLTVSLEEARKNIEYLSENEKRLESKLAHSEHLRLHHEGESKSTQDELNEMETEVKQLRADLVKSNMELNHSSSSQDEYRKMYGDLQARMKELEDEILFKPNESVKFKDELV